MGAAWYATQGIDVVDTPRGGRVTYHGPGQLVGYAIIRTDDVVEHVRSMERSIVTALAEQGIDAHARIDDGPDFTGVWVGERKIASIGVHLSKGVTAHGFAVNVDNDLQPFEWIVPCGLHAQMTSVCRELGDGARTCPASASAWRTRSRRSTAAASGWSALQRLLAREPSIA